MLLIFISIIAVITSSLLIYYYVKSKQQQAGFQHKIADLEQRLESAATQEQMLHEKMIDQEKRLHEAFEDSITGFPGWKLFYDRLLQNINHSQRHQLSLALLVIEINEVGMINDTFGDEAGDLILHEIGERIRSCLRQADSGSRMSKDRFAVMLTQVAKPESAVLATQRILRALADPILVQSHQLHLAASIGIALFPQDSMDGPTLIRNAEHALENTKAQTKNSYQFYQKGMQHRSERELLLCSGLSSETLLDELLVRYEPIINTKDNSIICMDVKASWQHGELGEITFDELYRYAERQRKLDIMTEWVLQHACKKYNIWQNEYDRPLLLGLPLNIKQLENSNFIYRLSIIMQEAHFNPKNLLLEIRDNAELSSIDILEKTFNILKYLGVKIAMSDFGSGALSLRYIRHLEVSYLKMDPRLIDNITVSEEESKLVKSVIQFAKSLSMHVVAQCVVDNQQAEVLQRLGCQYMQGRLFGDILTDDTVASSVSGVVESE